MQHDLPARLEADGDETTAHLLPGDRVSVIDDHVNEGVETPLLVVETEDHDSESGDTKHFVFREWADGVYSDTDTTAISSIQPRNSVARTTPPPPIVSMTLEQETLGLDDEQLTYIAHGVVQLERTLFDKSLTLSPNR
jgi:hypothetical protein